MIPKSGVCVILSSVFFVLVGLVSASANAHDFSHFRQKRQADNNKCILPPHPKHGVWKLLNGIGEPGDKVQISTVIIFECNPGYKLSSNIPSVCLGQWSSEVPECEKLCPPFYPSNTYDLKCIDKIGREVNCSEATHGSNLEYNCKDFYETPFGFKKTLFCVGGRWDSKPICQPICGKKIANDTNKLIYGSKPSEHIEYPWVAAIYQKFGDSYENICGGSILSETVVLTAAHCVTNDYGDVLPKENYLVGVGKLYRSYLAPEDTRAQYLELLKTEVPKGYKANTRSYASDIAILVVKGEFVLNAMVQPVCFTNLKNIHLHAGNKGEVAGWGLAEDDRPSEVLRSLVIPYKYETVCADELPAEWGDRYNLADKMCAGFVNKSTSVCKGDSGAGLAFKYREDSRYYVHGVVSVGLKLGHTCNIQQNAIYTRVASYYDFVSRLLSAHAPKVKDCILPPYPQNGNWTTDVGHLKPGDVTASSTVLKVECDANYKISSRGSIECSAAHSMPTCDKLCGIVDFPAKTIVLCYDENWNIIDCFKAVDKSSMCYYCPNKYVTRDNDKFDIRICEKGSWGSPKPECIRILKDCGKKVEGSEMEHPWNVGVYKLSDNPEETYKYVCAGSLVSKYAVLTNTQCVTDLEGNVLRKEDYLMAAGKFYSKLDDSRDTHAQILNISVIIVHPAYRTSKKSTYTIAILIASSAFDFNSFVQPICLIDGDNFWKTSNVTMIGWRFGGGASSGNMEMLEVKYLNDTFCDNPFFYESERICAGFDNESICLIPEDSGKGLVAKNPKDDRYYLQGMVNYYNNTEYKKNFWTTNLFFYTTFLEIVDYMF